MQTLEATYAAASGPEEGTVTDEHTTKAAQNITSQDFKKTKQNKETHWKLPVHAYHKYRVKEKRIKKKKKRNPNGSTALDAAEVFRSAPQKTGPSRKRRPAEPTKRENKIKIKA